MAAQYECLHPATRIYTANRGVVAVKEIEPGDRVFSLDEESGEFVVSPVRAAAETGTKQTYAVKTRAGTVRASDNHPFLVLEHVVPEGRVRRGGYHRRWKTVAELEVGDLVAVARDLPDFGRPLTLPAIHDRSRAVAIPPMPTSADLLWLLGYYLGDGSVQDSGRTHRVQFAAPARDAELRQEIVRIVRDQFGVEAKIPDDDRVVANSAALTDWIYWIQMGGTAHTKRVPEWVFTLPGAERLAFLAGYVDADGYVSTEGATRVTSVNEPLLSDIAELARLCGLGASAAHPIASTHPLDSGRTMHAFRMTLKGDVGRLPLRNPRRIEQRAARWRGGQSYTAARSHAKYADHCTEHLGFTPVVSIEEDEIVGVWDVEVDGPHNFVAEGVVVHNSEVVYHSIREDLEEKGVLFLDTDTALKEHPEIFQEYFGTVIPVGDNKFAALNTSVWSGGSFVYVPPGVHVEIPLQAYFRINTENMGQFERTLIIVDEDAYVHYVEGCTAPIYSSDSLHSAVVEIIVKKGGRCRYTTIQNWSNNVYNLVTKRAVCEAGATMEWVDGNIGSKVTMKYPAVYLMGEHAKGETLSIAFAGEGQHQDAGAKMVHAAPNTSSSILSKSVARGGGRTSYRGLIQVNEGAHGSKSNVLCDALLVDQISRSDTYPYVDIREDDVSMGHEASVSKVSEDQLFYLMSRGMEQDEAMAMIVRGFVEPIAKELPMEYALELNRLIELQMEGAVG
ncbi:MAG: Fe-S cluster assembly protein SufB [Nocardioides sp.]